MPNIPPLSVTAIAAADGTAEATFGQVPVGFRWQATSVTVRSTSLAFSSAALYKGIGNTPSNLLDQATLSGNGDTTGTIISLGSGEFFRVRWTGATPGAECSAIAYVEQARGY